MTFQEFIADPRTGTRTRTPIGPRPIHPDCMPACDGGPWPDAGTTDAVARQQIEFLAAYYHLNRLHQNLRALGGATVHGPEISTLVAELRRAIEYRDFLEDQYAPVGFDAEPEMVGPLAANLVFRHARRQIPENHRRLHPQETRVKVPLPDTEPDFAHSPVPGIPAATILADLSLDALRSGTPQPCESP